MRKQKLSTLLLLSIFTLGIYSVYWLFPTRKGLVERTKNPHSIPSVWLLLAPLLIMTATLLAGLFPDLPTGLETLINLVGGIAWLAMIIVPFWWFWFFYQTVNKVTNQTSGVLMYVIGLVLTFSGFGVLTFLIVQDDINKFLDGKGKKPLARTAASKPATKKPAARKPAAKKKK